jgi:hypothetical protein
LAATACPVGTVSPSAFAVLRLIISSTLADCCTGKSAGFSPLRMRPAWTRAYAYVINARAFNEWPCRHRERGDFCLSATSSSLIFSRSRSVTSHRNREFSSWSSAVRSSAPRVRSGSLASGVATNAGRGPGGALRHRCKVMTLTPSVRAISLCNFPCVANSFACASFVAISALEYLVFLAHGGLLSTLPILLQIFRAHHCNGTRCSVAGSERQQIAQEGETDRLAIAQKSVDDCNLRRPARLTCVVVRRDGM